MLFVGDCIEGWDSDCVIDEDVTAILLQSNCDRRMSVFMVLWVADSHTFPFIVQKYFFRTKIVIYGALSFLSS